MFSHLSVSRFLSQKGQLTLLILQPFNCNADVDGQMFHSAQGYLPDITALEVYIEVHTHLPEFLLILCFGKEGLQSFVIASDNLEGDEVSARFQQKGFFRLDVEILRIIRNGNVEIDGLVEHVDKRFLPALDAVDVDGCDAVGDVVAVHSEQDVLHEERLFGLGNGTYFPPRWVFAPQDGADDPHILQHIRSGAHQILLFRVTANGYGGWQFPSVKDDDHVIVRSGNRIGCRLVRYVEKLQRITRHIYFKATVGGRNGPDLEFGNTELDIFDSFTLFIDDPPFDGDVLCAESKTGSKERAIANLIRINLFFCLRYR